MKTYRELEKEIEKTEQKIAKCDKICKDFYNNKDFSIEFVRANRDELHKAEEKRKQLKIEKLFLENNARLALYNDNIGYILDILKKYAGKPYGEKTKGKMENELRQKTNCAFYIYDSYIQKMCLYPLDKNGFCCGCTFDLDIFTKYENGKEFKFLIENKIQVPKKEDLYLSIANHNYYDDVKKAARDAAKNFEKAKKAAEALETAYSFYNASAVEGLPHLCLKDKPNYII